MHRECINLPLSMYTEWYRQMDLKNRLHLLKLRMDAHAQWEIQEYAIATVVKATRPMVYNSFERHILRGAKFSADEITAVNALIAGKENPLEGRRLDEFQDKLD